MFVRNKAIKVGKAYLSTFPSTSVPASLCLFAVVGKPSLRETKTCNR